MEKLFVPYELADKLKEKGFDEICFGFYNCISMSTQGNHTLKYFKENNLYSNSMFHPAQVCAPTYDQVTSWFRENYNICVSSDGMLNKTVEPNALCFMPTITTMDEDYDSPFDVDSITDNYYISLNEAIKEALKLI